MKISLKNLLLLSAAAAWSLLENSTAAANPAAPEGRALFEQHCLACHGNGGDSHAPQKELLSYMSTGSIYHALTAGAMRTMAADLSDEEKRKVVEYLSGRKFSGYEDIVPQLSCKADARWFNYSKHPTASGWGITNHSNDRFIPRKIAGITPDNIARLKLKWAIAFPNTNTARSQPAIAGGAMFIGDENGDVYAFDAKTGCMRWQYKAEGEIRTAVTISDWRGDTQGSHEPAIYFGDGSANVYALNAVTGKLIWKLQVDSQPLSRITGSPTLLQKPSENRLYVPVSSLAPGLSVRPDYSCCTFRGFVAAIDADSGQVIWKSYAIPSTPSEQYKNSNGVPQFGPSGAGVWNTPTLDERRGRLYVGTGENSSSPTENGGAVVAMDLKDGKIAWVYQNYPQEAYNTSCHQSGVNCPREFKGRFGLDVSSSPMLLRNAAGREIIVAAQKTGDVFGLDPDANGKILWRRRITRGDFNISSIFGMAAEGENVFANVVDLGKNAQKGHYWGIEELGIYAMNGFTGEPLWLARVLDHCETKHGCRGYSAALTSVEGIVFAGSKDGVLRAFDSANGKVLWRFNTADKFKALNGDIAKGGDMDGPGVVVADGMVYVNSGYASGNAPLQGGNALLAFAIDE